MNTAPAPRLDDLVAIIGANETRSRARRRRGGLLIALPLALAIGAISAGLSYQDGLMGARNRDRIVAGGERSPGAPPVRVPMPPPAVEDAGTRQSPAVLPPAPQLAEAAPAPRARAVTRRKPTLPPASAPDEDVALAAIEPPQDEPNEMEHPIEAQVASIDTLETRDAIRALRLR